ncbi:hypothetical protein LINGRAHAP2_LOCUS11615 [Linum grandiflorum]
MPLPPRRRRRRHHRRSSPAAFPCPSRSCPLLVLRLQ